MYAEVNEGGISGGDMKDLFRMKEKEYKKDTLNISNGLGELYYNMMDIEVEVSEEELKTRTSSTVPFSDSKDVKIFTITG